MIAQAFDLRPERQIVTCPVCGGVPRLLTACRNCRGCGHLGECYTGRVELLGDGDQVIGVFVDTTSARSALGALQLAAGVRALLVDARGRWRDDVGGADFVQAVSELLDQAGEGGGR
jgi:hypothetical protein